MKRTNRLVHAVAFAAVAATLTACDDSTAVDEFDDAMVLDAAILAADATVEEVTMWGETLGFGMSPAAIESQYDTHTGSAAMGRPGGRGDWSGEGSGTRSVTCYDEQEVEQEECDRLTTESMHLIRDIEGMIERDNFSAEISRERDMWVTGLLGEETHRTWNGEGSSLTARSGVLEDGSERSHTVEGEYTFEDVVVPIPGSENRWPVSGTITRTMTVTRISGDTNETRTVEIVVTFDGTEFATIVINGEVMEIDLSTREGRNPLRRRRG